MKWLLLGFLGTTFACGYLIGVEAGKKILMDDMRKKSEDFLKNLRVVPMSGIKDGPSPLDDLISGLAKKTSEPGVS